jgi:CBS domain-containing protein
LHAGSFGVDIDKASPLVMCSPDDLVVDVFRRMIDRNIFAVPVVSDETKDVVGMLDMWDIATYVMQHFGKERLGVEQSFWELVNQEYKFQEKRIHQLERHRHSHHHHNHVSSTYSIFTVCEVMVHESVRIVPVIQSHQHPHLVNVITQSQVIRWLNSHRELIGAKSQKLICQCEEMFKPVVTVSAENSAMSAFELMSNKRISGVAVVNDSGQLVENVSVRDVKLIGADASMFWRMQQTVMQFTHKLNVEYLHKHKHPRHVIYVTPTATIQDVMYWFVIFNIHRVYIVDNHVDRRPIGIASMRGILQECITP